MHVVFHVSKHLFLCNGDSHLLIHALRDLECYFVGVRLPRGLDHVCLDGLHVFLHLAFHAGVSAEQTDREMRGDAAGVFRIHGLW